jgi:hypothetical protein
MMNRIENIFYIILEFYNMSTRILSSVHAQLVREKELFVWVGAAEPH